MTSRSRSSRRRWSDTLKKRLVAEASQQGATVDELLPWQYAQTS
jgi:transposase-like protein